MTSNAPLPQTLIILSGCPAVAKTTLARQLPDVHVATWIQVNVQRRFFMCKAAKKSRGDSKR